MEVRPDESDIPGVVGRRSARLSIIVPVTVRGTDAAGQAFKENTWTISVNKHGGRIATFHQLAADDQIVIENPLLGRTAKARVNRVCEKRFAEDPYEVCVELLEAQNVWGVKLPPEDWQKEQQSVSGEQKSPIPQAAPQAPKTPAATAEKGGMVETAHLAPRGSPAELGEHTGGLSQFNMAVNALSRFAGEAKAPPAQPASQRQDAMGVPKAPAGPAQAPDPLALKALQEKIGEAQSLRQELSVLTDRVHSYKEESETAAKAISVGADSAVDSLNRAGDEAVSKLQAAHQILELSLKKAAEDALELLKEALRSAQQQCVDETQRQLAAARESTLTSLESEAGVNLASFRERLHTTLLEMQAQQTKEMEKGIQTGLQGLLESLRTQIHLTADESAAQVTAEVRGRAEQVLQEPLDRLYQGVGMAALVAKEWEEQAKTHLEAHLSHVLEVFQKQLEALTMAAQERQRSEAEALEGLLRSRLHQAARLFEDVEADAGQSKGVAREESSNSPFQSLRTSRDPLPPALDPLVERQQRIIEEALSAFRSALSRILANHAPKE